MWECLKMGGGFMMTNGKNGVLDVNNGHIMNIASLQMLNSGVSLSGNQLDMANGNIMNVGSLHIPSSGITLGGNQFNMANGTIENVGNMTIGASTIYKARLFIAENSMSSRFGGVVTYYQAKDKRGFHDDEAVETELSIRVQNGILTEGTGYWIVSDHRLKNINSQT